MWACASAAPALMCTQQHGGRRLARSRSAAGAAVGTVSSSSRPRRAHQQHQRHQLQRSASSSGPAGPRLALPPTSPRVSWRARHPTWHAPVAHTAAGSFGGGRRQQLVSSPASPAHSSTPRHGPTPAPPAPRALASHARARGGARSPPCASPTTSAPLLGFVLAWLGAKVLGAPAAAQHGGNLRRARTQSSPGGPGRIWFTFTSVWTRSRVFGPASPAACMHACVWCPASPAAHARQAASAGATAGGRIYAHRAAALFSRQGTSRTHPPHPLAQLLAQHTQRADTRARTP